MTFTPVPPLMVALLDSGPLGLLTHPKATQESGECKAWLSSWLSAGHSALVPEVIYYEVRRELRRTELKNGVPSRGLANLEAFAAGAGLVPITSEVMVQASEFWAEARHKHIPGAPDAALDADMILCAQAKLLNPKSWNMDGATVVIATTNVKHLEKFALAQHWRDMTL